MAIRVQTQVEWELTRAAPVVTRDVHDRIMKEVIEPTIEGMAKDGLPYTGFLYAGRDDLT